MPCNEGLWIRECPCLGKQNLCLRMLNMCNQGTLLGHSKKNYCPPPPPWTRAGKFEPPRKKDQSADAHPPSEIGKFLPFPPEKMLRSKDADGHNPPQNWLFWMPPQKFSPIGGCVDIKWNGPFYQVSHKAANTGISWEPMHPTVFFWGRGRPFNFWGGEGGDSLLTGNFFLGLLYARFFSLSHHHVRFFLPLSLSQHFFSIAYTI
jgi:hypothetical protein